MWHTGLSLKRQRQTCLNEQSVAFVSGYCSKSRDVVLLFYVNVRFRPNFSIPLVCNNIQSCLLFKSGCLHGNETGCNTVAKGGNGCFLTITSGIAS